jgi:hypothetical protein
MGITDKPMMTPDEAVSLFGIPKGTLANLRSARKGCKFYRQGKRVYYRTDEFLKWITSNPVMTLDSMEKS